MENEKKRLEVQGFTRDQIIEIEEGEKAGLDVSVYSDNKFLAIQMRQIRLGMQKGLKVEKYARLEYDWFQMEEIRKGLAGGVDVDLYASPEISYDRMHQIRKGLCAGIDLSPYKKLDAGILKQLLHAIQKRINIVQYINAGYDAEQLGAIRVALEKGLEIDPYLRKDFRGISIHEICEGLEHGLDVTIYAQIEYCWQQMREIRLGLEHMVDVDQYCNAYYSWQQMREIRLGLEEGLDVSYYRSFLYTAVEMQKRRLQLQENPSVAISREELPPIESDTDDWCQINISSDELEAYIEVQGNVTKLRRIDILKALRNRGITYGIQYEVIDNVVSGNSFRKSLLIAQGKPEKNGDDGWYEYFFRTQMSHTPKHLKDGNVDFREVEWFETVEEGQKLAYYHNAMPGKTGMTVTGRIIPARRGREQSILTGSGFKRLPDGKTYVSTKQGIVTIRNFHLEVSRLLVMRDVNLSTGDVNFDGNVCIEGNVSSGTRIRAAGDIVVKGFVESAKITCGGNALFQQGMNGGTNGSIRAGKDVFGYFFEGVDIYTSGNIQGDYFLNCKMHAEGTIVASGHKGMIAGGSTVAEQGLRVYNLGNIVGIPTHVKLGTADRLRKKEKHLEEVIQRINAELFALREAHQEFQRKYPPEIRNTMEIYLKIENAVYTKEKQFMDVLRDKESLEEERKKTGHVSAVIDRLLYEGVVIEIDGAKWRSKEVRGITIRKKGDKIAIYSHH